MIHVVFITFIISVSLGMCVGRVKALNETLDSLNHANTKLQQCHGQLISQKDKKI